MTKTIDDKGWNSSVPAPGRPGLAHLASPVPCNQRGQEIRSPRARERLAGPRRSVPTATTGPASSTFRWFYNERVGGCSNAIRTAFNDRFSSWASNNDGALRTADPDDISSRGPCRRTSSNVHGIESSFSAQRPGRVRGAGNLAVRSQSTGHRFGLKSDGSIDERSDPAKAPSRSEFWKTLYGRNTETGTSRWRLQILEKPSLDRDPKDRHRRLLATCSLESAPPRETSTTSPSDRGPG